MWLWDFQNRKQSAAALLPETFSPKMLRIIWCNTSLSCASREQGPSSMLHAHYGIINCNSSQFTEASPEPRNFNIYAIQLFVNLNSHNYCISELWPLSSILETRKHIVSESDLLLPSGVGEDTVIQNLLVNLKVSMIFMMSFWLEEVTSEI
jgi:hypothetical protein